MKNLSDLPERSRAVFWHPCVALADLAEVPPLPVVRAEGCRFVLADGRSVLDSGASWWSRALGHGHPRVIAALREQAGRIEQVIPAHATHEGLVRWCERLVAMGNAGIADASHLGPQPELTLASQTSALRTSGALIPDRAWFGRVFLADNGSTGIEVALKLAMQFQRQAGRPGGMQRTRFACLAGGYHGETVGAMSVSDLGLYKDPFRALCFDALVLRAVPWRSGPRDPVWQDAGAEWMALLAQLEPAAANLAGIIVEPVVQGAGGMRPISPDLLRRMRGFCDAHGILLIHDEIFAGFGRTGPLCAAAHAGIAPDLAVFGKGLTAGAVPQAAVLVRDALLSAFSGDGLSGRAFLHSTTHAGNALACAAGNAVLDAMAEDGVLAHAEQSAAVLHAGMAQLAATRPQLRRLRGIGMVAAVDLCAANGAPLPRELRAGRAVLREGLRRGALFRPLGDTLYLCPPLTTTPTEIEEMLAILAASIDAVSAGLPR